MKNYFADSSNIYISGEKVEFKYSDGNENEEYILSVIQQASDITTGSDELFKAIKDWPSLYHLSPKRADLLRPLNDQLKGKKVLEIGSGCGAITRYLGEANANVIALEGSYRRAMITSGRCRDLTNVEVVCDNFSRFDTDDKFDFVTLIGVLEYSNLYMPGDDPVEEMLRKAMSFLTKEGTLVIAIENKLGLKYWTGAPEDHTGKTFFGIENKYSSSTAITFGKKELQGLLTNAGFTYIDFLYPFPDYKLVDSVITEKGMTNDLFDVNSLLFERYEYVQSEYYKSYFSTTLVANELRKNKLLPDYANSFLILAGGLTKKRLPENILAYKYSTQRQKAYCKETLFTVETKNIISVRRQRIYPKSIAISETIRNRINNEIYSKGPLLSYEVIQIVSKDKWGIDELIQWARNYYDLLYKMSYEKNNQNWLDGKYIDLAPFNIITKADGSIEIFDLEWVAEQSLPLYYVLFRGIVYTLGSILFFNEPDDSVPRSVLDISIQIVNTFTPFTDTILNECKKMEASYFSSTGLGNYIPFTREPLKLRQNALDVYNRDIFDKYRSQAAELRTITQEKTEWEQMYQQRTAAIAEENQQLKDSLTDKENILQQQALRIIETENRLQQQHLKMIETEKMQQQQEAEFIIKYEEAHRLKIQLMQIHSSEGWKLLSFYYRIKAKILPENSHRYKLVKKLFNKIRGKKG